ncbi:MAG: MBOAT family protein [Clostridia bacterium]|nr:MBOAT family protein [Clostridia bacterium]
MSLISLNYLIFLPLSVIVFYVVPKKFRYIWLTAVSIAFYALSAPPFYTFAFVAGEAMLAYFAAVAGARLRKKGRGRADTCLTVSSVTVIAVVWLLLNGSGLWAFGGLRRLPVAASLGISYYSLQLVGYLLDTHWEIAEPQKNPLKILLFACFYPQMTAGPIHGSSYIEEICGGNGFDEKLFREGCRRILWGFFKKLVICERVALIVNAAWGETLSSGGEAVLQSGGWKWVAILLFPYQLYTDFSGCMDIVTGSGMLYGIRMPENFNNPFFSQSVQEFWQRWHITLGQWAKNYIFYPLLKTRTMQSLSKKLCRKFGKKAGRNIVTIIALFVLWLFMGIWHGEWHYVVGESAFFWLVISLSLVCAPLFDRIKKKLKISDEYVWWKVFRAIRTYLLYCIGIHFFRAPSFMSAFKFLGEAVSHPISYLGTVADSGVSAIDIVIMCLGAALIFAVSLFREKNKDVDSIPVYVRITFLLLLFAVVLLFGCYGSGFDATGFIYNKY